MWSPPSRARGARLPTDLLARSASSAPVVEETEMKTGRKVFEKAALTCVLSHSPSSLPAVILSQV